MIKEITHAGMDRVRSAVDILKGEEEFLLAKPIERLIGDLELPAEALRGAKEGYCDWTSGGQRHGA
jgi:hypothetical protein